jgi:hypothetical protein
VGIGQDVAILRIDVCHELLTRINTAQPRPVSDGHLRSAPQTGSMLMPIVRIRLIGSETDADALITVLHGLDGIEHIEQVADLMPHMDDDDSSSAGLIDDIGPGVHAIEIEVPDHLFADRVRELAGEAAETLDATVEFIDEF